MVKKIIIFILAITYQISAQQNLVPNPGFESYISCPQDAGAIIYTSNWYAPTIGTPDYFDTCFTFSQPWTSIMDVPQNFMGNQNALSNSGGYSGLFAFYQTGIYREYIQAKLTSPLVNSVKYFVSFYVSLADNSCLASDEIGAYLSSSPVSSGNVGPLNYTPQISNPQNQIINNKLSWKRISGTYIANGSEEYITIGNFKADINTDTVRLLPYSVNQDFNSVYYYIDGVCVSTDSLFGVIPEGLNEYNFTNGYNIGYDESNNSIIVNCKAPFTLKIFDVLGYLIHSSVSDRNERVQIMNLKKGIYIVWINNFRIKFIIN